MNAVQSMGNPEATERTFLFENATNDWIPPYATMQIVKDPTNWVPSWLEARSYSDWNESYNKVTPIQKFGYVSNDLMLYCDKPSVFTEMSQDPWQIAFNGAGWVGPRKKGKCHYGVFPAKALATEGAFHPRVVRNSWFLRGALIDGAPDVSTWGVGGGAFNQIGKTDTVIDWSKGYPDGKLQVFMVVPNPRPEFPSTFASGSFDTINGTTATSDPVKLELDASTYGTSTDDSLLFGKTPTMTINVPGIYDFIYVGSLGVAGVPSGVRRVDYQLEPIVWPTNEGTARSLMHSEENAKYLSSLNPLNYYPLYLRRSDTLAPWDGSTLPGGVSTGWDTIGFILRDQIAVSKVPYQLGIGQTLSPYASVTDGYFKATWNVQYGWRPLSDNFVPSPVYQSDGFTYNGVGPFFGNFYWQTWRCRINVVNTIGTGLNFDHFF